MFKTLLALLVALTSLSCSGPRICYGRAATLSGTVFDFVSKKPLPHAAIKVYYLPKGTDPKTYWSDRNGNFSFQHRYKGFPIAIIAKYPGYKPLMDIWAGAGIDTEAGQSMQGLQVPMVRSVQMSGRVTDEQVTIRSA